VVKGTFINLGINLFEILYFPKLTKDKVESFVSFQNYDLINEAFKVGKGTFFLSGHISNWELQGFAYAKVFRTHLNLVAKSQTNKRVNRKINQFRELSGNKVIEVGGSLRNIFMLIKRNELVTFIMDQSAPPDYSVYTDFFGKKVSTFTGPAKIALKNNTVMLFVYPYRNKNFKYIIRVSKINYDDLVGGATDENVAELTARINQKLEMAIREAPRPVALGSQTF
jgi:Kdo2-lipid IVA lauroyltransferase/acyltransferase